MKFGENLREIRKNRKITQEALAEKVGVSRQSVSKWENGESYPEIDNIEKLCKIFHCKIGDLVNDTVIDGDFLGEEIKQNVIKFKKDEQKKMKRISKIGHMFSKIGKVASITGIISGIFLFVSMVLCLIFVGENQYDCFKQTLEEQSLEEQFKQMLPNEGVEEQENIPDFEVVRGYIITGLIISMSILAGEIPLAIIFDKLDKLCISISNNSTPFKLSNVNYVKKIGYCLLFGNLAIDLVKLISIILELKCGIKYSDTEVISDIGGGYLSGIIILMISYIFKYGYEVQLDSKGKMYDDEEDI